MDPSLLRFPKKSHRKIVSLPPNSIELAELLGIIAGDGGIGNEWQFVVLLNSKKDKDYAFYVKALIKNLFHVDVVQRKRPNQNTTILITTSTMLVDFLVEKGATRGNKIFANLDIPLWIRKNTDYAKRFVRGLVDTDGCLYLHRHTVLGKPYVNIGFCFTCFSKNLLLSTAQIFKEFGLSPHLRNDNKRIYFYSEKDVIKYLDVFGSSNPRIYNVFNQWRDSRVV